MIDVMDLLSSLGRLRIGGKKSGKGDANPTIFSIS
jgi:hypothetical protein